MIFYVWPCHTNASFYFSNFHSTLSFHSFNVECFCHVKVEISRSQKPHQRKTGALLLLIIHLPVNNLRCLFTASLSSPFIQHTATQQTLWYLILRSPTGDVCCKILLLLLVKAGSNSYTYFAVEKFNLQRALIREQVSFHQEEKC